MPASKNLPASNPKVISIARGATVREMDNKLIATTRKSHGRRSLGQ